VIDLNPIGTTQTKIVVFGATGMIGTRIAAGLERHDHAVTAQ
jgi:nucleoside-diphosphate-sugar epimerase